MIENSEQDGIEETFLNIVKVIYQNPTTKTFNGENLKAFPLKLAVDQVAYYHQFYSI